MELEAEKDFQVNTILPGEVTKVTHTLSLPSIHGDRVLQQCLHNVINSLGIESAAAQGLSKVATTAEKLYNSPGQVLYLMKDANGNGGKGKAIGMLKMGRKKLFLYDAHAHLHEVEPLCVLDFYMVTNRQRHGYGKILFDYMLQDMGVKTPHELAIDGPSCKLDNFLLKHYGIALTKQSYKFSISPKFFEVNSLANGESSKSGRSTPAEPDVPAAIGRFAASHPRSTVGSIIHGNKSTTDTYDSYNWYPKII